LRSFAALAAALAAGHLTQTFRPAAEAHTPSVAMVSEVAPSPAVAASVPKSASLSSGLAGSEPDLVGITSVAAEVDSIEDCPATLGLSAATGAMIHLSLSAPCNRGERVVVRHSGLSFTARTDENGSVDLQFPALQSNALVAVYLEGSAIVLGEIAVPDAASMRRFSFQWASAGQFDLRVTEDDRVFVGGNGNIPDARHLKVVSLGIGSVQNPMFAEIYTFPPATSAQVDLTVELRIGPDTCGQTLVAQIVSTEAGKVTLRDYPVAVPLCGTSGDILVLKNLAPDLTLATPR
jgi:hypothetical protein